VIGRAVQICGTDYDGSPHWLHRAYLVHQRGGLVVTQTFAGAEVITHSGTWISPFDARGHYWADRWYNVIRLDRPRGQGLYGYYCNVATPAEFDGENLHYSDLQIDVRVYVEEGGGWRVEVVDEDEFEEARRRYAYPESLVQAAHGAVGELRRLIEARAFPFRTG
jgi:protein associated with RNAse G/E